MPELLPLAHGDVSCSFRHLSALKKQTQNIVWGLPSRTRSAKFRFRKEGAEMVVPFSSFPTSALSTGDDADSGVGDRGVL